MKKWLWYLSEDKLVPLLLALEEVKNSHEVANGQMMTITITCTWSQGELGKKDVY